MDAQTYTEHQAFKSLQKIIDLLTPDDETQNTSLNRRAICEKVKHLQWCFKNSDHELFTSWELQNYQRHFSDWQNYTGIGNESTLDDRLNETFKQFNAPRNKRIRKSDTASLVRDLNAELEAAKNRALDAEQKLQEIYDKSSNELQSQLDINSKTFNTWSRHGLKKYIRSRRLLGKHITNEKSKLDSKIDKLEERFETLNESLAETQKRKISFFKRLLQRGIDQNQKLQDRFLLQMRYRAPVALWEARRINHEEMAKKALMLFGVGAAVFCTLFVIVALCFGDYFANAFTPQNCTWFLPQNCQGIAPKGILYMSTTLLVASIGLWLLRLQMKTYLSERHLALDAEEKKAFAETYLALVEDKSVTGEQEAVVLQSLFRPTQDGIIRDDNLVETSPAGMLAKLLEGRRT